jgi:hypothetical protein
VGGIRAGESNVRNHGLLLATTLVERRSSSASEAIFISIVATTACQCDLTFARRIGGGKGDPKEIGNMDDISIPHPGHNKETA